MEQAISQARIVESVPTVLEMLQDSASRFPENEAIVFENTRVTYRQLTAEVAGLASRLSKLGAKGQRVAIVMPNGLGIVVAIYAVYAAGAQAVPLNPDYTEREINEILRDANVLVTLCGQAQYQRVGQQLDVLSEKPAIVLTLPSSGSVCSEQPLSEFVLPSPTDFAKLQYTGGTTGRSKGVMLTHENVAVNVLQREALIPMRPGIERILCVTPLYHAYATAMALYPALSSGGALVIQSRFKPEHVFDALEREQITLFAGAPAIYYALASHPLFEKCDLSSLSASFSGSAPLSLEVLERWQSVSGAPILEGYGLTESSPILTFNPRHGVRKPGSVGLAALSTTIEIVDPVESDNVLGCHQVGEIRARGPQLMSGYRNLPQETAAMIRDGWLYTGDLGELDEEGYLFIRGRKKEMVIVGGFNVYPREIEEQIFTMEGVQDCAVVGVKNAYLGEVLHAFIVARPGLTLTETEVLARCEKNLVRYKVPKQVHFVEVLPRTAVGKLDRARLSEMGAADI